MKYTAYLLLLIALSSCSTNRQMEENVPMYSTQGYSKADAPITRSLFDDKSSTISEENIQKILDGNYSLPQNISVAIVQLESAQNLRGYYWNDETYLKSQQEYLDLFTAVFEKSEKVTKVLTIPDLLISSNPTFTSIREAAVRTQADIAVVYSMTSDLYSKYKMFGKSDIKAFATTQLIILDVRTGLIPFSAIVTKEFQSKKQENELDEKETANRVKNNAALLSIEEIGRRINTFLEKN